jgi:hypothetical protein
MFPIFETLGCAWPHLAHPLFTRMGSQKKILISAKIRAAKTLCTKYK